MTLFKSLLTWWNGQTIGTRLYTMRKGNRVGEDAEGNVFYENRDGSRRWVIYNGEMEASRVGPDWHGWLHHTFRNPPTKDPFPVPSWGKSHSRNLTGTGAAYVPKGSLRSGHPEDGPDYEAWKPE